MSFLTHLTAKQLTFLACSVACMLIALYLFKKGKTNQSVVLLVIAAYLSRYMAATLDPFLHMWDEQFHALVAKNLAEDPFTPILYKKHYYDYDYRIWGGNHIWVHKQPWFLWQMALSIKLFGCNEVAVRLPSVIMSALMVFIVYRIGSLVVNKKTGWYAAFICAMSFGQIEFITGNVATDHNDVAFMFYMACSFWAFFEFIHSDKKMRWAILTGVFAGIAVLNKWLAGLAVFSGWAAYILFIERPWFKISVFKFPLIALLVAVAIALPWQLYILHAFPAEAQYELAFNSKHFSEVIESHGGSSWFHLDIIPFIYGRLAPFFVCVGLISFFKHAQKKYAVPFLAILFLVYLFYTLAATKMTLFTLCAASLMFVLFGSALYDFLLLLRSGVKEKLYTVLKFALLLAIGIISLNADELEKRHSVRFDTEQYTRHLKGSEAARKAAAVLKNGEYVVFNCDPFLLAEFCFYSGQTGITQTADEKKMKELQAQGVKIAVFNSQWVPDYMRNDKNVVILPKDFKWIFE